MYVCVCVCGLRKSDRQQRKWPCVFGHIYHCICDYRKFFLLCFFAWMCRLFLDFLHFILFHLRWLNNTLSRSIGIINTQFDCALYSSSQYSISRCQFIIVHLARCFHNESRGIHVHDIHNLYVVFFWKYHREYSKMFYIC